MSCTLRKKLASPCASVRFPPTRFCDFHKVMPSGYLPRFGAFLASSSTVESVVRQQDWPSSNLAVTISTGWTDAGFRLVPLITSCVAPSVRSNARFVELFVSSQESYRSITMRRCTSTGVYEVNWNYFAFTDKKTRKNEDSFRGCKNAWVSPNCSEPISNHSPPSR